MIYNNWGNKITSGGICSCCGSNVLPNTSKMRVNRYGIAVSLNNDAPAHIGRANHLVKVKTKNGVLSLLLRYKDYV